MKYTLKQSRENQKKLKVLPGNKPGHWDIQCEHYGRTLKTTTTNTSAVDDWQSDPDELDPRFRQNRKRAGYNALIQEILNAYY